MQDLVGLWRILYFILSVNVFPKSFEEFKQQVTSLFSSGCVGKGTGMGAECMREASAVGRGNDSLN